MSKQSERASRRNRKHKKQNKAVVLLKNLRRRFVGKVRYIVVLISLGLSAALYFSGFFSSYKTWGMTDDEIFVRYIQMYKSFDFSKDERQPDFLQVPNPGEAFWASVQNVLNTHPKREIREDFNKLLHSGQANVVLSVGESYRDRFKARTSWDLQRDMPLLHVPDILFNETLNHQRIYFRHEYQHIKHLFDGSLPKAPSPLDADDMEKVFKSELECYLGDMAFVETLDGMNPRKYWPYPAYEELGEVAIRMHIWAALKSQPLNFSSAVDQRLQEIVGIPVLKLSVKYRRKR